MPNYMYGVLLYCNKCVHNWHTPAMSDICACIPPVGTIPVCAPAVYPHYACPSIRTHHHACISAVRLHLYAIHSHYACPHSVLSWTIIRVPAVHAPPFAPVHGLSCIILLLTRPPLVRPPVRVSLAVC